MFMHGLHRTANDRRNGRIISFSTVLCMYTPSIRIVRQRQQTGAEAASGTAIRNEKEVIRHGSKIFTIVIG